MNLADALLPLLPGLPAGGVVALVGGGGKTSALFGLAGDLAGLGHGVLLTTTTHIFDPRIEGRSFDRVELLPALGRPGPGAGAAFGPARAGERVVLGSEVLTQGHKLRGIHPSQVPALRRTWPFVLVEADGAKGLPVKAPAGHEPVLPAHTDLVLGVIGLDCLGRPMDALTVHRPERFGPVAGCADGEPIRLRHLQALVRARSGLFKGAPEGARRVVLLNKADRSELDPAGLLLWLRDSGGLDADLVLLCSLANLEPGERVLARFRSQDYSEDAGNAPRSGADRI